MSIADTDGYDIQSIRLEGNKLIITYFPMVDGEARDPEAERLVKTFRLVEEVKT